MNKQILNRKTKLLVYLLLIGGNCFAQPAVQENAKPSSTDTIIMDVVLGDDSDYDWLSIGTQYDYLNAVFGVVISNGFDEMPLIHFEDFQDNLVFKLHGQAGASNQDYAFGGNVTWRYPDRYIPPISMEYRQFNYTQSSINYKAVNMSMQHYWKNLGVCLEIGHQALNDSENIGVSLGLKRNIYLGKSYQSKKFHVGASVGYYSNYFTYSAYLHGFLYKTTSLRLMYERIGKHELLNVGVSFMMYRNY